MLKPNYYLLLFAKLLLWSSSFAQGIPSQVMYEPDEGGYPHGYNPAKKLGIFDLSNKASNEPFRHLIKVFPAQEVVWENVSDFRDFGFMAACVASSEGKPKFNRYVDINEASFREAFTIDGESFGLNPMYAPDPSRDFSAQGKTYTIINGPFNSVTIDNVDEAAKTNPFILTEREIDRRARAIADSRIGFIRWDIESIFFGDWNGIARGRQVWEGGKYRHNTNGGTNPEFKDMDDGQFFNYVQERWSYIYTELYYKTRLYSKSKIWAYGLGPIGQIDPGNKPQFDDNGNISSWWSAPNGGIIWRVRNRFNNRVLEEELDYMEPTDFIPYYFVWAIVQKNEQYNYWYSTDIIRLKESPKTNVTAGVPTRYYVTDLGTASNGNRRARVSLHAQDGSLRVAHKELKVSFQHWRGHTEAIIPAGSHSVELTTTAPEQVWADEEQYLMLVWNTLYCSRYIEPTKLGFANWEPTPRTFLFGSYPLSTSDLFEQRIYDAMIAFSNLQNFGVVHWDANTEGKVPPMVREGIILAQKKIAPYKNHFEDHKLIFTDISLDGGQTWVEGGYPNAPYQQRYNGWWMHNLFQNNQPAPVISASYNDKLKTFLIAHLSLKLPSGNLNYKVRVKNPVTNTSYTFDISSTRDLTYSVFKI